MFDRDKFKSVVHYVCWRCSDEPSKLGSVKLNKTLWLSDLAAYYRRGRSITGARYVKRQFGPVPSAILPTLRDLENEDAIQIREAGHFGYRKKEYIARTKASLSLLSTDELSIIDQMIEFVCDQNTAASISEASHDHIWKAAEDGEEIPHYTVFAIPEQITEDDVEWAKLQLEAAA